MNIAAVVNLHAEGASATPSLISAFRACEQARTAGLEVDLVLMVDGADEETTNLADHWAKTYGAMVLSASLGDLGMARNHAASAVDADWIAFLDGDDLWGEEWLLAAHAKAGSTVGEFPVVFHPQVNIVFGDHHSLLHHIDSTDPNFRWSRFHLHNAWTALSFVQRELVCELPYPRNDLANGLGFEDWSWNMAVLDAGGQHLVVPDTCHFIKRVDGVSLLGQSQRALRTRYPSTDGSAERAVEPATPVVDIGTHLNAPVELSERILRQVGLAATIEPSVANTLSAQGTPSMLPQNFNTHNTAGQLALEELWRLREDLRTIGQICDMSETIADLDLNDRAAVVAEFLRTEVALGRAVGESSRITEALAVFPQLTSAP